MKTTTKEEVMWIEAPKITQEQRAKGNQWAAEFVARKNRERHEQKVREDAAYQARRQMDEWEREHFPEQAE